MKQQPSKPSTRNPNKVVTSVSLPVAIKKRGIARAKQLDRDFSGHVSALLRADLEQAEAAK